MSFGYIGDTSTSINQSKKNQGIIDLQENYDLEKDGNLGGALELIDQADVSGQSEFIFTNIKEAKYDTHLLTFHDYTPSVNSTQIGIQFYENGVLEDQAVYQFVYYYLDTSMAVSTDTGSNWMRLCYSSSNATGDTGAGHTFFYGLGDANTFSYGTGQHMQNPNNTSYRTVFGSHCLPQASVVNKIRIFPTAGNFDIKLRLYGMKEAV